MASIYVDKGYRTLLGTGFYDRVRELAELEEHVASLRTVIVYGPRNAGKSELVRYFAARRAERLGLSHRIVFIDARQKRLASYLGGAQRDLVEAVDQVLSGLTGLPRGLVKLAELVASRLKPPSLLVLDEFHLLFQGLREAMVELEAVAGYLAKRGEPGARLLVTVSEGFFATVEVLARLTGYSVGHLLVEPMDEKSFTALYHEYRERYGCSLDLDLLLALAGPSPGYLVDLCTRSRRLLEAWVADEAEKVMYALNEAAKEARTTLNTVVEAALDLLEGRPPRTPLERTVGEKLVEHNVAYPCTRDGTRTYLPQLPLHLAAVKALAAGEEIALDTVLAHSAKPRRCVQG